MLNVSKVLDVNVLPLARALCEFFHSFELRERTAQQASHLDVAIVRRHGCRKLDGTRPNIDSGLPRIALAFAHGIAEE